MCEDSNLKVPSMSWLKKTLYIALSAKDQPIHNNQSVGATLILYSFARPKNVQLLIDQYSPYEGFQRINI